MWTEAWHFVLMLGVSVWCLVKTRHWSRSSYKGIYLCGINYLSKKKPCENVLFSCESLAELKPFSYDSAT